MNTNYAGFWLRFVAFIIDSIIIGCVRAFVIVPILAAMGIGISQNMPTNMDDPGAMMPFIASMMALAGVVSLISMVITVLYYAILESSNMQASIGKLALGLVVLDESGQKIDFSKALIRNLGKIVSSMILFIGFIMAGFTDKKQGLHDIIAKTIVVKKAPVVAV
jgi:uncharacterized RDD family membrane protein YckC